MPNINSVFGMFARSILCFLWSHLCPGHVSNDVIFQVKILVCFFQLLVLNILTWTIGYSKLSSGNFYSILLCSLGVHSSLEDKDNLCCILQYIYIFFFFCASRLMRPLSKIETRSDSSLHNIVENIINIILYQIDCVVCFRKTYHKRLY